MGSIWGVVKGGLALAMIFLGVRVGGDIAHYVMTQMGQTPSSTPLS